MKWQQIREQYPHNWLVVEAIDAFTQGSQRVVSNLEVVGVFGDDWQSAWERYKLLHHTHKQREYYVLHTDRVELNIGILDAFGRVSDPQ